MIFDRRCAHCTAKSSAECNRHSDDGGLSQALTEIEADAACFHDCYQRRRQSLFRRRGRGCAHSRQSRGDARQISHRDPRLIASKKITIAAVHGHCLGGGAELAMVCDMVFTTESAQWGFPEIKLGCYPPVACAALAALVGQKRAAELILTGRTIRRQGSSGDRPGHSRSPDSATGAS